MMVMKAPSLGMESVESFRHPPVLSGPSPVDSMLLFELPVDGGCGLVALERKSFQQNARVEFVGLTNRHKNGQRCQKFHEIVIIG
jgi:hypothetical protein